LFLTEVTDYHFINDRIQSAYIYFFDKLDQLEYEILYKIEEVKRIKLVKQFYDELVVLEDLQTKAVMQLMKAKLLMETIMARKTISKESLNSSEIKNYKINKIERVIEDFKRNNRNLIEDQEDLSYYEPKKSLI
jgi:hypothetical protein